MSLYPQVPLTRPVLSAYQVEAVRRAMQLFVDDDLARGISPLLRYFCHACERARAAAGFVQHGPYQLCNLCATEYEVAQMQGTAGSIGQFVRDKRFGDAELHALRVED